MKNNITITAEPIKSSIEFDFYLKFLNYSHHNSEIYEIYLRLDADYMNFGKCYIRSEHARAFADSVKVFPHLSSFYEKVNNLDDDVSKIIAKQIESIIREKIK